MLSLLWVVVVSGLLLLQLCPDRAIIAVRTIVDTIDGLVQFLDFIFQSFHFGLQRFDNVFLELADVLSAEFKLFLPVVGIDGFGLLAVLASVDEPAAKGKQSGEGEDYLGEVD